RTNLRANVTALIGDDAEVRLQTGYTHRNTRSLNLANPYTAGASRSTPGNPYGDENSFTFFAPEEVFSNTSTERVHRFFGSIAGRWQAARWLTARATVGLDVSSSVRQSL